MAHKRFRKEGDHINCYSYNNKNELHGYFNNITKTTEPAFRSYRRGILLREIYYKNSIQYNENNNEPSTINYRRDGKQGFDWITFTDDKGAYIPNAICYVKFNDDGGINAQEFCKGNCDYITECFEK